MRKDCKLKGGGQADAWIAGDADRQLDSVLDELWDLSIRPKVILREG